MEVLKSNPRVMYRLATAYDIEQVIGQMPPYSCKSYVFFYDGEPVAIGGWKIHDGIPVVFSDIKEGVKVPKTTVYRCALEIMKFVKKEGFPMYVVPGNRALCERLGFVPVDASGEVLVCRS